tara:strand:+ start:1122 stop:1634 length:513 start_codon:yes stop_codon:yes gene_type:complete
LNCWAIIPSSPYEVSKGGEIRRVGSTKPLKLRQADNGYLYCSIIVSGKKKSVKPHRMVMEVFVGLNKIRKEVNHKDGNKLNNKLDNLEWMTPSENKQHAIDTGLKLNPFGRKAHNFKGTIEVLDSSGKVVDTLNGHRDIKSKGYSSAGVSSVLTGRQKTHKNKLFRRIDK